MDPTRRRFTIADGMILVAASAAALVDVRRLIPDLGIPGSRWANAFPGLIWAGVVFTLALIPIRLSRPRPGRDDLWRLPGWVACASVAIAMAVGLIQQAVSLSTVYWRLPRPVPSGTAAAIFREALLRSPMQATIAIAATWSVLILGGRWQSDPGWIDRLGRAVGGYWLVISLLDWMSALFL